MPIKPITTYNAYKYSTRKPCIQKNKNYSDVSFNGDFKKRHGNVLKAGLLSFSMFAALMSSGCAVNNKSQNNSQKSKYVYTVQEGDSLSSIVRRYIGEDASWDEVSSYVEELAETNGIEDSSALEYKDKDGNPVILDTSCFKWEYAKEEIDKKLGSGFCDKLSDISDSINCSERDLASVIYSESSFDIKNVNSKTSAAGLLQFTPDVLNDMGYTTDDILNMSAIEQLDLVEDYFLTRKHLYSDDTDHKINSGELYALVLLPAYVNRDVLLSNNSENDEDKQRYERNSGLDIDNDGNISKSDLTERMKLKYEEMLSYLNIEN